MRKLCIAVILFSFLGFGPLESFFQRNVKPEGNERIESTLFQKLKETADSIPLSAEEQKMESFLITGYEVNNNQTGMNKGLIITRDTANNKVFYGKVSLPIVHIDVDFNQLKEWVKKNYQIPIDHCFIIDSSGAPKIVKLLSEIEESNDPNQLFPMFPSLLNEARHSVKTDLDYGEIIQLGLSAIINPITNLEPLQINEKPSKAVNLDIDDNNQIPMVN